MAKSNRLKLSSFQIIILGFLGLIIVGTVLLMMPFSSNSGSFTSFNNALFTATSAVCVTGLIVVDTAVYWSIIGQIIILILIQIGGLGIVTVFTLLPLISGGEISLRYRTTIQDATASHQIGGIVRFTKFIYLITFIIEAAGAALLMISYVPRFGAKGVWMSIFESISAFCNAGFDVNGSVTGEYSSLTAFNGNSYLILIFSLLIVFGGIGFMTWQDIIHNGIHLKKYRMQSKVIIVTSLVLILLPAIFYFLVEFHDLPFLERLNASFFQSVTTRTAGFNSVNLTKLSDGGKALMIPLMIIGGSPGSTAGGMKTTTFAVIIASLLSIFSKRKNIKMFNRRLEESVIRQASTLFILYIFLFFISAISISIIEQLPISLCLFECASAIGTVGLSLGITSGLSVYSQIIIVFLMFIGRVGGLTLINAANYRKETPTFEYPVEKIVVG